MFVGEMGLGAAVVKRQCFIGCGGPKISYGTEFVLADRRGKEEV